MESHETYGPVPISDRLVFILVRFLWLLFKNLQTLKLENQLPCVLCGLRSTIYKDFKIYSKRLMYYLSNTEEKHLFSPTYMHSLCQFLNVCFQCHSPRLQVSWAWEHEAIWIFLLSYSLQPVSFVPWQYILNTLVSSIISFLFPCPSCQYFITSGPVADFNYMAGFNHTTYLASCHLKSRYLTLPYFIPIWSACGH